MCLIHFEMFYENLLILFLQVEELHHVRGGLHHSRLRPEVLPSAGAGPECQHAEWFSREASVCFPAVLSLLAEDPEVSS